MLGASLLQILARGGWTDVGRTGTTTRATTKEHRARKSRVWDEVHSLARRTTDKRHWHNAADPRQAARIEAAAAKRARKAEKLQEHANRHWHDNTAHDGRLALYPFSTYQ